MQEPNIIHHAPEVPIVLQLAACLERVLQARDGLREKVCEEISRKLDELLEILGIPGRSKVQISSSEAEILPGQQPVRVFVNGQLCTYPDELLRSADSYAKAMPLGAAPLRELSGKIENLTNVNHESIAEFLHLACLEIVKRQPAVLLGAAQAFAYKASIPEPLEKLSLQPESRPLDPSWLRTVLAEVINLRISLSEKEKVATLLHKGIAAARVPADIAEELIVNLTPDIVEIHLPPEYRDEIIKVASVTPSKRFASQRQYLYNELGLRYPAFRLVAEPNLKPHSFAIRINHIASLPRIGLAPDQRMVAASVGELQRHGIQGSTIIDPIYGVECAVVDEGDENVAREHNLSIWDPLGYLCLCLDADLRETGPCFVHYKRLQEELDRLTSSYPDLERAAREKASIEQITRIVRSLIGEGISIRNFRVILELLLDYDYIVADPSKYLIFDDRLPTRLQPDEPGFYDSVNRVSFVRSGLKRYLSHKYTDGSNKLSVYLLDEEAERLLSANGIPNRDEDGRVSLEEDTHSKVLGAIRARVQPPSPVGPFLLTTSDARATLRDICAGAFPRLPVLAYQELSPDVNIEPAAQLLSRKATGGKHPLFRHPILSSRIKIASTGCYDERDSQIDKIDYDPASRLLQSTSVIIDGDGRLTEISYFNPTGKPIVDRDGHAKWIQKHDSMGRLIEIAFFDLLSRPAPYHGYVRCVVSYDGSRRVKAAYYGPDGELAKTCVDSVDCSKWMAGYDERGNITDKVYFDRLCKPYRKAITGYDDRGNQVEKRYFGSDGKPAAIDLNGVLCSGWRARYDDSGALIERTFFDREGRQMSATEPSLQFSVTCLEVIEDKGPPTLRYLFYELPLPVLPHGIDFYLANCWANGLGSFEQSVKILYPDRIKILVETGEKSFVLGDPYTPFMAIFRFSEIQFSEEGRYWIQNYLNGKLILEYPVTVRLQDGAKEKVIEGLGVTIDPAPRDIVRRESRTSASSSGIAFDAGTGERDGTA